MDSTIIFNEPGGSIFHFAGSAVPKPCNSGHLSNVIALANAIVDALNDRMFPWADNARRKRILDAPWPRDWEKILTENSAHAALLGELRRKWQQTIQVLVAEKNWEGCGGLTMTTR